MNMFRTLLEFLIQRSVDHRRPLAGWLQWLVRRDSRLDQFYSDAQKLDEQLRTSAAARHRQLAEQPISLSSVTKARVERSPQSRDWRPVVGWISGLTVAAALVLFAFVHHTTEQQTKAARIQFVSAQFTSVPGEMLDMLNRASHLSQSELPRYSPLEDWSELPLPRWENVTHQLQAPVQHKVNLLVSDWTEIAERFRVELMPAAELQESSSSNGT